MTAATTSHNLLNESASSSHLAAAVAVAPADDAAVADASVVATEY